MWWFVSNGSRRNENSLSLSWRGVVLSRSIGILRPSNSPRLSRARSMVSDVNLRCCATEEIRWLGGSRPFDHFRMSDGELGIDLRKYVVSCVCCPRKLDDKMRTNLGGNKMSHGVARRWNIGCSLAIVCHEYVQWAMVGISALSVGTSVEPTDPVCTLVVRLRSSLVQNAALKRP